MTNLSRRLTERHIRLHRTGASRLDRVGWNSALPPSEYRLRAKCEPPHRCRFPTAVPEPQLPVCTIPQPPVCTIPRLLECLSLPSVPSYDSRSITPSVPRLPGYLPPVPRLPGYLPAGSAPPRVPLPQPRFPGYLTTGPAPPRVPQPPVPRLPDHCRCLVRSIVAAAVTGARWPTFHGQRGGEAAAGAR